MRFLFSLFALWVISFFAFGAAATMYATPAGAGTKDGLTWANAFGYAEFETDFEGACEAGDIYYVYSGTYTQTSSFANARHGTTAASIKIIGISDQDAMTWAEGDNRPLFLMDGTETWTCGNYWEIYNIRGEGVGIYIFTGGTNWYIFNCKATNASASANSDAFFSNAARPMLIQCEGVSTNGQCFAAGATASVGSIFGCFFHDSLDGWTTTGNTFLVANNVFARMTQQGINVGNKTSIFIVNNILDNCVIGVGGTTATNLLLINNVITNNTTGVGLSGASTTNILDFNNFYGNTGADVSNVSKGTNTFAIDPMYTNAAGNDYSITAAGLKDAAVPESIGGVIATAFDLGAIQVDDGGGPIGYSLSRSLAG